MDQKWDRNRIRFAALCVALMLCGCNFFGGIDSPNGAQDAYSLAVAKADAGDCAGARDLLKGFSNPEDKISIALGWAYLCLAGATASSVATSLYNYNSTSGNLTVVGNLARSLLPMSADKLADVSSAIAAFGQVANANTRNLEVAIAQFVNAAAILANQATNTPSVSQLSQGDISVSACGGVDCTTGSAACVAGPPGMSDADVANFVAAVNQAGTSLSAINSTNLSLLKLAQDLSGQFTGGTALIERCVILNQVVPAN